MNIIKKIDQINETDKISKIKIYGERNSGTIFLTQLLSKNLCCSVIDHHVQVKSRRELLVSGWKHGVPEIDLYDNNNEVLYVIIFRNLDSWLKSFFDTQYCLVRKKNFENFLIEKNVVAGSSEYNPKTKSYINISDANKDIFEIRYYKCQALLDFFEKVPNIIQVNLDYLQNNSKDFINLVSSIFDIKANNNFDLILQHTKSKQKDIKNREYKIEITDKITEIISNKKNNELEKIMETPLIIKKNNQIISDF